MGDVIKDAIYERNLKVEERFGIDLVFILGAEEKMCNDFRTVVLAGSDEYDLFMGHQLYSAKIFTSGVFADWNQTGIDFSKPWFPPLSRFGNHKQPDLSDNQRHLPVDGGPLYLYLLQYGHRIAV